MSYFLKLTSLKNILYYSLILFFLFQSCGTSSNVTSNFALQKRKYTKGWDVKDLVHHKMTAEVAETELNSNNQQNESRQKTDESLKTKAIEEIKIDPVGNELSESFSQVESTVTNDHSENKLSDDGPNKEYSSNDTKPINNTSEEHGISKATEESEEKIPDMLFRIFFIIGFSIAILTIILTLLELAGDAALVFLLVLFLLDVTSLFIVLAFLIRRVKNKNLYKEPSYLVVLTELVFGIISAFALILWIEYAF